MALKGIGTDNKRNVIIAAVLGCVLVGLVINNFVGGSSTPAPVSAPPRVAVQPRTTASPGGTVRPPVANGGNGRLGAPAARQLPGSGLDPALHLEKLALSESIEYAGTGRNIFSADSAPVQIDTPLASARPVEVANVPTGPPPPPQPPAIDLHYFGYSADKEGKRQAFLLHGDDIFEASAGEIVNHRYKVVSVDAHSVQVTDLSYNNTQTLQLTSN